MRAVSTTPASIPNGECDLPLPGLVRNAPVVVDLKIDRANRLTIRGNADNLLYASFALNLQTGPDYTSKSSLRPDPLGPKLLG